jgi:hypothetical protein
MNQQVELVALGLSATTIKERMKQARPPAEQALSSREADSRCKSAASITAPSAVKAWYGQH